MGLLWHKIGQSQAQQRAAVAAALEKQAAHARELLQTNLERKGQSFLQLMERTAPHFLDTYDYGALERLAADLEEDPEVAFVQFLDAEGRPLTAAPGTPREGADVSAVEAELSGEVETGRVRMGLDFQRLREERALADRHLGAVLDTQAATHEAAREKLVRILAGFGVAAAALVSVVIYLALQLLVIRPTNRVIGRLEKQSGTVGRAAESVSESSGIQARSGSEQAAALQETAASLEEMNRMTRETEQLSRDSEASMERNVRTAKQALEALNGLTERLNRVSAENGRIRAIMKTIDDIAFQTNLLALNAAVEAARAGREGAGFGVVAGEVRDLAGRAKLAANQTAELLDGAVTEIEASAVEVLQLGERFREVREAIEDAGRKTAAISSANREQARGIDQITAAAAQLDAMTQNVSASAQMSAGAAEDLANLVRGMEAVVGDLIAVRDGGGETIEGRRRTALPRPERLTECRLVLPET